MKVCGIRNVMTLDISDYEDPRDFYRDEWLDSCELNASDGSYGFFPEDGEAQLPVSKCTPGTAVEEMATPVRLQQDSWDTSVSLADIDLGPVMDFLGPPCCRGPTEMEDSRIPDFQEYPGADIDPGPAIDFLGPPCCQGPTEMEDSRIPDFQECPGASCDTSGDMDVAYTMGTGMWAPETVVVRS